MTKTGADARPVMDVEPESFAEFVEKYQRPLVIGAVVLALGGGGWWMANRSAEIRETRANEALIGGESAYASGNKALAQVEFEKLVVRYAGTTAGTQGGLISAQLYLEEGKLDSAETRLQAVLPKAPKPLRAGVLAMLASTQATAGRLAEAAVTYEQAAGAAKFRADREQYQMDAARLFAAAGNYSAARTIYQTISGMEDSGHASEARLRLGELVGKS